MKREPNEYEKKSRERIIQLITDYCNGSQQEFADRVGIGKSSVSHYVKGQNFPTNVRAAEIARAFGLNPMWVMGFDAPKLSGIINENSLEVSGIEKDLVLAFRNADHITQNNVLKLLDVSIEKEGASSLNA